MRTSRISQDTTRIFNAISANNPARRSTRSSKTLASFALGYDGSLELKDQQSSRADSVSDASPADIEDCVDTVTASRTSRKRKYDAESHSTAVTSITTERISVSNFPLRSRTKDEPPTEHSPPSNSSPRRSISKPKIPARKAKNPDGTVTIHPPSNWEHVYNIVREMRQRNPTAPVDTMGCEDLFWPTSPPRDKRYHTLTSLMLSSQTKDPVTAAAMQRLHTELVPQVPNSETGHIENSALTLENVLACDPQWLDELIGKVGFHNNKTKYIKATAKMLRDEYNCDIPDSVEGLMRLPGVGPKMAYLCMSAAWGKHVGIGVDVHVHRITNLWGWHSTKNPEETRAWLEGWLPKDKWHEINKTLVGLGQTICLPVGRKCGHCDLAGTGLCKGEIKGLKVKEKVAKVEKVDFKEGRNLQRLVEEDRVIQTKEELVDS